MGLAARGTRETTVDLGIPNNGRDEPRFHRDGHTVDHPGSCGSLHRKQTTAVSRLPRNVARSVKQLLESFPLLAAQQSLSPYISRDFLYQGTAKSDDTSIEEKNKDKIMSYF